MFKFLHSDTTQSTLRIVVFIIAMGVTINLVALPILIAIGLMASQDLSWVGGYVTALAALSGAGVIGKALQKKYETIRGRNYHRDDDEDDREIDEYVGKERHM